MASIQRKAFGVLLSGIIMLSPTVASAAEYPENIISTQGHGEVKVKPDSLSVSVMVEATDAELAKARAENTRKMQAIISAIKGLNIPNLKMETQNVQVFPMQGEYERNKLPKTLGYRVTNGLNITVTKAAPEMLGEYGSRIADRALTAGANHLNGMNFYLDDMSEARIRALREAVQDARKNAQAMAESAGVTITGVYSMEGTPQYSPVYPMDRRVMMRAPMAEAAAGGVSNTELPIEPGEATITSDVNVKFKF